MQETAATAERKLPLSPVDRETVQERVYRRIREMILNGEIEPGQTITIPGLSAAFQVSAMPVREALRRLMAEQALMVVAGRSVGIPALTRARLADLRRVRREVEGLAIAWAAERAGPAELRLLSKMVSEMELAADARDGRRYVPANHDFHFTIYRAADSPTLFSIIESLGCRSGPISTCCAPRRTGTPRTRATGPCSRRWGAATGPRGPKRFGAISTMRRRRSRCCSADAPA